MNSDQFSKAHADYRKVQKPGDNLYPGTTTFTAYSGKNQSIMGFGYSNHATASVDYDYPHEHANFEVSHVKRGQWASMYHDLGQERDLLERPSSELFHSRGGKISSAFADPTMTPHVATLLGAAINEHRRVTGSSTSLPMPSEDLSPFSSKLVRNSRKKGIPVPENPDNSDSRITNDITRYSMNSLKYDGEDFPGTPLSTGERSAARQTIHGLLKRPKESPVHPAQFGTQGKLF